MVEKNNQVQPFKNRLFQLFNASSAGDDPQRREFYQRQGKKRKGKTKELEESWEKETQSFFDDFISLDEEKITKRISKEKAKRAFDRKYRQSQRSQQSLIETEALADTFELYTVDPEVTAEKCELLDTFLTDVDALFTHRIPLLAPYFDLFSLVTLKALKAQGFSLKYLKHLIYISSFKMLRMELAKDPRALLTIQLTHQFLDLPSKLTEQDIFIEKHCVDVHSFQSLLNQTFHYIETNLNLFDAIMPLIQSEAESIQPFFLSRLRHPYLKLEKELARYYLKHRFETLKSKVKDIQQKMQAKPESTLEDHSGLIREWKSIYFNLAAVEVLTDLREKGYPLDLDRIEARLQRFGLDTEEPEIQRFLKGFTLEDLDRIKHHFLKARQKALDFHFYPRHQILSQSNQEAVYNNQLNTLEQWSIYKAQQVELFKKEVLFSTLKMYEDTFQKEGAIPPESAIPLAADQPES